MKTTANRFAKGSAVYKCQSCGRSTRATGRNDNEHSGLCAECYDLAGIENQMSDDGATAELEAEAEALRSRILEKGGNL